MSLPLLIARASITLEHCHPSFLKSVFALWYDISHKALDYFASLLVNLLHVPIHGFSNVTNIGNIVTIIGNIVKR